MTNVIKMERIVEVGFVAEFGSGKDSTSPFANEMSTHGFNKPRESFEEYCERMEYHEARHPPHFPVPAIRQGFEFVQNVRTGEVGLVRWYQEPC